MTSEAEAKTDSIVNDVIETYGLDASKAEQLVEIAVREASREGSGKTVSELAVSAESRVAFGTTETRRQFGLSRRDVLKFTAFGGLTAAVGGLVLADGYEYVKGKILDQLDEVYFSKPFIRAYIRNRKYSDLVSNLPPGPLDEEKRFVDLFGLFVGGNSAPSHLTPDHEAELQTLLRRAGDESTKLVIADLLAAHYVRLGLGHQASRLLSAIDSTQIVDSEEGLLLTNQKLSVAYTTLDRGLALRPFTWEFDRATLGLDWDWFSGETGIGIADIGSGSLVRIQSSVSVPGGGPLAGPLGFYVMNWLLLHWVAQQDEQSRSDAALLHLEVLKGFANQPDLVRQVWNFSYIAGLQLHRFGVASENQWGDFSLRDTFFDVCLGQAEGFESVTGDRLMNLRVDDPVPFCMAMLLRSDPSFGNRNIDGRVASIGRIASLSGAVRSLSIRRAADQFRDLEGTRLTDSAAWDTYAGDDGTLSIYTDHPSNLRSALVGSRG